MMHPSKKDISSQLRATQTPTNPVTRQVETKDAPGSCLLEQTTQDTEVKLISLGSPSGWILATIKKIGRV